VRRKRRGRKSVDVALIDGLGKLFDLHTDLQGSIFLSRLHFVLRGCTAYIDDADKTFNQLRIELRAGATPQFGECFLRTAAFQRRFTRIRDKP